jgi:hypothetical protein
VLGWSVDQFMMATPKFFHGLMDAAGTKAKKKKTIKVKYYDQLPEGVL